MIHTPTLIAILFIAATTYLTRILGYVLLKNRSLTNKATSNHGSGAWLCAHFGDRAIFRKR